MLNRQNIAQFIRFCVVGTLNAGVDFVIYLTLTRLFAFWQHNLWLATAVSFSVASTNSYFLNKYWAFQDKTGKHTVQYPKFIAVSIVGLGINLLAFSICLNIFHLHDIISKIIAAGIVLFWNFAINKFWTFASKQHAL